MSASQASSPSSLSAFQLEEPRILFGLDASASSVPIAGHDSQGSQLELFKVGAAPNGAVRSLRWLEAGLAAVSRCGEIEHINESFSDWLDSTPDRLRGLSLWEGLRKRQPAWWTVIENLLEDRRPIAEVELRAVPPEEGAAGVWYRFEFVRSGPGGVVRLSSILPPAEELAKWVWDEFLQNESGRREMFVRMLRAETQIKNLMRLWPGVIFNQRPDFSFRFASAHVSELTGYSVGELQRKGSLFWNVLHEDDIEKFRQRIKQAQTRDHQVTQVYRIRHARTGRIVYVLERRQIHTSRNGLLLGYEGAWLDVTRQMIAEKRLSTVSWKENLAVLTLGLAHDFTNVVSGIHSLSESFLSRDDRDHSFDEGMRLIKESSLQASHLVQRIISLHRGKAGEFNYYDLNEMVSDVAGLGRKIVRCSVVLEAQLWPEPLPVYTDPVGFRRVVINMLLNALDAMPGSGRLRLQTSRHETMPALAWVKGKMPALPVVCLAIEDTGHGIESRHLANLFEPFFTTKSIEKGSGLGLYNARIIIEKSQGAISVESREGEGTIFRIWLPEADLQTSRSETAPCHQGAGQGEGVRMDRMSLLVVGQSEGVVNDTVELLRGHGYHVVGVRRWEDALAQLKARDNFYSGVLVLAEPQCWELVTILPEMRRQAPGSKIVVKLVGWNLDDLESRQLDHADLTLPADLPTQEGLGRLESCLASRGNGSAS